MKQKQEKISHKVQCQAHKSVTILSVCQNSRGRRKAEGHNQKQRMNSRPLKPCLEALKYKSGAVSLRKLAEHKQKGVFVEYERKTRDTSASFLLLPWFCLVSQGNRMISAGRCAALEASLAARLRRGKRQLTLVCVLLTRGGLISVIEMEIYGLFKPRQRY